MDTRLHETNKDYDMRSNDEKGNPSLETKDSVGINVLHVQWV